MSKKKMCKWHKKSGITECDWQDCKAANPDKDNVCPANTNSKCEIIPKKPSVVRVKAWGNVGCISGKLYSAQIIKDSYHDIPCTILIDKKYLRRKP